MNPARKAGLGMLVGYGLVLVLTVVILSAMLRVDCVGAWCVPWLLFEVAVFVVAAVAVLAAGVVLVPAGYALLRFGRSTHRVRFVVHRAGAPRPGAGPGAVRREPGDAREAGDASDAGGFIDVEARDVDDS